MVKLISIDKHLGVIANLMRFLFTTLSTQLYLSRLVLCEFLEYMIGAQKESMSVVFSLTIFAMVSNKFGPNVLKLRFLFRFPKSWETLLLNFQMAKSKESPNKPELDKSTIHSTELDMEKVPQMS